MEKKKTRSAETSSYEPPVSPVKIPDGDTGFNMVKNKFQRSYKRLPKKYD